MPRKQPELAPFLQNALEGVGISYRNLNYEDPSEKVASLYLPHKTDRLEKEDQYVFKDWYAKNKRKYTFSKDYTKARQAMTASLRKSDYVELVDIRNNKLIFKFLNKEEVIDKKLKKKELKRLKREQDYGESESSSESGYGSGINSPESCMDYGQNESNLLQGIVHDHMYVFSPHDRKSAEGSDFHSGIQENSNEAMGLDGAVKNFNLLDTGLMDDFSGILVSPEVVTLEDLDKLSDLIGAEGSLKEKWYVCKTYEPLDNAVLLTCKLLQEMDVGIADTASNIRIIFDEAVQKGIQGYTCLKKWEKVDDHHLLVILELYMKH